MKITSLEFLCIFIVAIAVSYPFYANTHTHTYSYRTSLNNDLKSLAAQVIAESGMTKGRHFKRTVTPLPNDHAFVLGGNIVLFDWIDDHPYDGQYFLHLQNSDGTFKKKLGTDIRIAMEVSHPPNGDGFVAVAFADGHVETIEYNKIDFTIFDAKEFLSIKGSLE